MKTKQGKIISILLVTVLIGLFAMGCGAFSGQDEGIQTNDSRGPYMDYDYGDDAAMENREMESAPGDVDGQSSGILTVTQVSGDKIIYRQDIHMETDDLDRTVDRIRQDMDRFQGYIQNYSFSHYGDSKPRGNITLRIPTNRRDEFVNGLRGYGNVTSENLESVNVSEDYYDMEANLRNLNIQERRLLELLEDATTLSDILTLESELSRIRREIERITGYLNRLDDQINYSTVYLSLVEVDEDELEERPFWDEFVERFKESFGRFAEIGGKVLLAIAGYFPFFLIALVIFFIIYRKFPRGGLRNPLKGRSKKEKHRKDPEENME